MPTLLDFLGVDLYDLTGAPRIARSTRAYDSHWHDDALQHRLEIISDARMLPAGGGSHVAAPRAPRRTRSATRKPASGGEDGDGAPARPSVAPRLYRVSDAMQQLSVSRATLYRLVAADKLRLVKIGSASRITAESIEALASSGA